MDGQVALPLPGPTMPKTLVAQCAITICSYTWLVSCIHYSVPRMIRLYHRWSYNIHRFHYAHSSTRWHHHTTPKNHGAPAPLLILAKISTHIHSIEPEWCDVEPQLLVSPGVVCRILDGKAQAHVKPGMMRLGWLRHGGTAGDSETILKLQRSILPCDNVSSLIVVAANFQQHARLDDMQKVRAVSCLCRFWGEELVLMKITRKLVLIPPILFSSFSLCNYLSFSLSDFSFSFPHPFFRVLFLVKSMQNNNHYFFMHALRHAPNR